MTDKFSQPLAAQILMRKPGPGMASGHSPSVGIPDAGRAVLQHQTLQDALSGHGISVTAFPSDPLFPESFHIGDVAVVTETLAVFCNFPADDPRQGEQKSLASYLAATRFLKFITAPGHLDARDVLQIGDTFYISLSARTNQEGAAQLAYFLTEYGYEARMLDMSGFDAPLRDSAVWLGSDRLLIRAGLAKHRDFLACRKIIVPEHEKNATVALMVNGMLFLPAGMPATAAELKLWNIPFRTVNVSEFEKMQGGISSLMLCLPPRAASGIACLPEKISRAAAA